MTWIKMTRAARIVLLVGQAVSMNSCRAIQLDSGRWAVELSLDGKAMGFTVGSCVDEAEACFMTYAFARVERKLWPCHAPD